MRPEDFKRGDYLAVLNGFNKVIVGKFTRYALNPRRNEMAVFWELLWIDGAEEGHHVPKGEYAVAHESIDEFRYATEEEIAMAIAARITA